jgi:peptide deformylase
VALLKILTLGDPILRAKASPVTEFDDALAKLAADMHETMDAAPGVGLAAPQVGVLKRFFVYNDRDQEDPEAGTLVNPEIVWFSEDLVEMEEGCLSIPGQYFTVSRPEAIKIRYQDLQGQGWEQEAHGYLSRIFQHETDHLDGILFIDRLDPAIRKEAMKALRDQDFGMSPRPRKPHEDI